MRRFTWLVVLAIAAAGFACGHAAEAPALRARSNEVAAFDNGGVRLAYEIDFPAGGGPFPAVVAGHGSGRVTRDRLRNFSRQWTSRGFAVLRFDKRGVGESSGEYSGLSSANSLQLIADLAGDVAAAARLLRSHPNVDPARVGLAGVSQAGWVLPRAARALGDAAFMVLLSGPVCTIGEEMYYSELAERTTTPLDDVYKRMPAFAGPHGYDPMPDLRAIDTPTLWLLGAQDRSIPVRTSVERLSALAAAGRPFEWRTYESLDHDLAGVVWKDIDSWVQRFKR